MSESALILLAAFLIDTLIGDPPYPFHPTRIMGNTISLLESTLRRVKLSGIAGGATLVVLGTGIFSIGYYLIVSFMRTVHPNLALLLNIYLLYSCIALRDLIDHAKPVARALELNDIGEARKKVRKIVGRKTNSLDASGVARATVESVAEGFVDGFFSPLFWFFIGVGVGKIVSIPSSDAGIIAVLLYRMVNTMDSMVGYRNERYMLFGSAGARMDDFMNFLPARIAIILLFIAALLCGRDAFSGLKICRRDRLKHASPNSAHTESFVAGALGLKLGGPTDYSYGTVETPWIGEGKKTISSGDITDCCGLVLYAEWVAVGFILLFIL